MVLEFYRMGIKNAEDEGKKFPSIFIKKISGYEKFCQLPVGAS